MSQTTELKSIKSGKKKHQWMCTECGNVTSGQMGKCTYCHAWGTVKKVFMEDPIEESQPKHSVFVNAETDTEILAEIPESEVQRYKTGFSEFDRVLGGGIVPGSLTLLGGSPGVGKSTILLQVASNFAKKDMKVFYVSAEESSQQLKLRASRLNLPNQNITVYTENNLEKVIAKIKDEAPDFIIVDSIQAVYLPAIDSIPGSITQLRESTSNLTRLAKATDIPIVLVGHINKDGDIAGPKILEHIVDAVLQFEGDKASNFRVLRSVKNRFGSTDEIGLFDMGSEGLIDLKNPSEIFLKQRSGGIVTATREGNRSLLLELQSLIIGSEYHNPRRLANGVDTGRLHQILAVLERKLGLGLSKSDVYINAVGGLSIKEPAADLAIALSIFKNARDLFNKGNKDAKDSSDVIALGEIGLSGEIRGINNLEGRLKEAAKLGFKTALVPASNISTKVSSDLKKLGLNIIPIKKISEAIQHI